MEYKNTKLNFVKNLNEEESSVDLLLFGEISPEPGQSKINGDAFGKEIVILSNIGFKNIRIAINSVGGSIRQGMSIVNSMNIARMNGSSIETNIVGVADSMAGMISAFGDRGKRTAANFSSGVVHEPLVKTADGKMITIEEMEDSETKSELLSMKSTLVSLMSSSTGKSEAEVKKTMKNGKRLTSQEMKDFGMVDKILKLSNEPIELENKTAIELMAACSNIKVVTKTKTMKEVNKLLGLSEDAAENSAVEAIKTLQNKVATQETTISEKETEITRLEGENEVLVNEKQASIDAAAEAYVDSLIEAGKLKKDNRDTLVNQAKKDFDGFKEITGSLDVNFVDVTKEINTKDGVDALNKDEKLAMEYHNHRVAGTLANFEKTNPTKFAKCEEAYMNSNTDFDSI